MEIDRILLAEYNTPHERIRACVDIILISYKIYNISASKMITSFILRHKKGIVILDDESKRAIAKENNFNIRSLSTIICVLKRKKLLKTLKRNNFQLNSIFLLNYNDRQFEIGIVVR